MAAGRGHREMPMGPVPAIRFTPFPSDDSARTVTPVCGEPWPPQQGRYHQAQKWLPSATHPTASHGCVKAPGLTPAPRHLGPLCQAGPTGGEERVQEEEAGEDRDRWRAEQDQGMERTWGGGEGLCGLDRTQWYGDDPTGVGGEDLGVAGLGHSGGEVTFGNRLEHGGPGQMGHSLIWRLVLIHFLLAYRDGCRQEHS